MNNAPFRVGQKMVRVGKSIKGFVKKGWVYTCAGCFKCTCEKWYVLILELPSPKISRFSCACGNNEGRKGFNCDLSSRFAPIPPRSIEIPESLKEQAEEMKDLAETIAPMKKELV